MIRKKLEKSSTITNQVNLFPVNPEKYVTDISENNFQSRVPVKLLKDLLLLCTDKVQFTFEGEYCDI
ncbi:unnamed protein product [Schistosoma curassoni]|uniref:DUF4806 domain-containing protein n=1 Tax=Schistosoma curassoni TaxID=6186 RepID=A0A183L861_9TREM|nr:unnamed protein product [Schistosoma curassoni]